MPTKIFLTVTRQIPASNVDIDEDLPEIDYDIEVYVSPAIPSTYWDPGCSAEVESEVLLSESEEMRAFEALGDYIAQQYGE